MSKEKIENIKNIFLIIVLSGALFYVGAKFLLPVVLPFAISFAIAAIMRRPSDFIAKKLKVSKKIVRPVLSVLIMIIAVGGFVFGIVRLAAEAWELLVNISEDGTLSDIISTVKAYFGNILGKLGIPDELESGIEDAIFGLVANLVSSAAGIVSSVASAVPKIMLFVLVSTISTVYLSIDLEKVESTMLSLLPSKIRSGAENFKKNTVQTLVKYVKSYFLIMLLTFAMVIFGLSVLGVKYAWLLAFIIAVLDLLPVLGIGIVLVPWALFMFLVGNLKLGIGLSILYAVATVIRQISEPRILGKNLGIHPLLTLVLMYTGYSLLGLFGLIVLPLLAVLLSGLSKKNIPPTSNNESASASSETQE